MRIDLFSRPIDPAETVGPAAGKNSRVKSRETSDCAAELSLGTRVRVLEAKLAQVPEIREERVAALQKQFQENTYSMSPEQAAKAVLADWS